MIGVDFETNTGPLRKKLLFEQYLFTGSASNPNTIRLLPALNISPVETELFLERFAKALETQPAPIPA